MEEKTSHTVVIQLVENGFMVNIGWKTSTGAHERAVIASTIPELLDLLNKMYTGKTVGEE